MKKLLVSIMLGITCIVHCGHMVAAPERAEREVTRACPPCTPVCPPVIPCPPPCPPCNPCVNPCITTCCFETDPVTGDPITTGCCCVVTVREGAGYPPTRIYTISFTTPACTLLAPIVTRTDGGLTQPVLVGSVTQNSFEITNVEPGASYCVAVAAIT